MTVHQRIGGLRGDFAQCLGQGFVVHTFLLVGLHHIREAQQYAVPVLRFGNTESPGGLGYLCAICSQIVYVEVARHCGCRIFDGNGKIGFAALKLGGQNVAHIYLVSTQ